MGLLDSFSEDDKRYCPKCHESFYPGECDIVATHPAIQPDEDEEVLYYAKKGLWARKNPKQIEKAWMKRLPARRCPNLSCKYLLPRNVDKAPILNIAVVGDKGSG